MARRAAREAAMRLLYGLSFKAQGEGEDFAEMRLEHNLNEKDAEYVQAVLEGCQAHLPEMDRIIRERARGWRFDRLSRVDLSVLRLALYEILYRPDIPESVSVNEGVELAKKYGNEKSGAFVNGILGTYLRDAGLNTAGSETSEAPAP